ncbi:DNA mismatch repair protein MutS [Sporodiniella umbellata]|nr:DNA mismatch repair protein MutS [Sporodiniella umbellata]
MFSSNDTIRSLNLFEYEPHPNIHLKHQKESLSLFGKRQGRRNSNAFCSKPGLLNKTKTPLGEKKLKEWIFHPTTHLSTIEERQASIAFLVRSDVRKEFLNIHDWHGLLKFVLHSLSIFDVLVRLKSKKVELPLFQQTEACFDCTEQIKIIGAEINALIDFETSQREGRLIINKQLDPELDELKKKYSSLDSYLLQIAIQQSKELPVDIGACLNVIYFPQMGYLITFPKSRYVSPNTHESLTIQTFIKTYLPEFQLQN